MRKGIRLFLLAARDRIRAMFDLRQRKERALQRQKHKAQKRFQEELDQRKQDVDYILTLVERCFRFRVNVYRFETTAYGHVLTQEALDEAMSRVKQLGAIAFMEIATPVRSVGEVVSGYGCGELRHYLDVWVRQMC